MPPATCHLPSTVILLTTYGHKQRTPSNGHKPLSWAFASSAYDHDQPARHHGGLRATSNPPKIPAQINWQPLLFHARSIRSLPPRTFYPATTVQYGILQSVSVCTASKLPVASASTLQFRNQISTFHSCQFHRRCEREAFTTAGEVRVE